MDEKTINSLKDKFPFLTYGTYLEDDYLGITQNCDNQFFSIYAYNLIPDEDLRKKFLKLGEVWWWESNRQLPISIFLKKPFEVFRPYLKLFTRKDFCLKFGPIVSLQDMMIKRIKRRTIQLVKKDPVGG